MSDNSAIEWTDATWNPVTGCDQISPGCAHCYAKRFAERFKGTPGHPFEAGFAVTLRAERLQQPFSWKRPRRIFVNSMSDLFHPTIPSTYIREVFRVMEEAYWHTFQILTKRSDRLLEEASSLPWPGNVWMGVSVENNRWRTRVDDLRRIPAEVKFLSCEPLLGPLQLNLAQIDWVVVGGESGTKARPMRAEWARSVRDQCLSAGVPFFFKQWGNHDEQGRPGQKKKNGRLLDSQLWDEMPDHRATRRNLSVIDHLQRVV